MKRIVLLLLLLPNLLMVCAQDVVVSKGDIIGGNVLVNGKPVPTRYKVWRTGEVRGHVRLGADEYGQPAIDTATVGRITIPDSILGPDGKYYLVKAVARQAFAHCRKVTDVIMPEQLSAIGDQAFLGCSSLTAITIPPHTKIIYPCAFRDCTRLFVINLKCTTIPRTYNDVFDRRTIEHGTLFIPAGTSTLYTNSLVWGMFTHRLEIHQ